VPGEIAAQLEAVRAEMRLRPPGLVRHVERVVAEALDLAARWDLDPERVALAGYGHDLFRAVPPAEQLELARRCAVVITPDDERAPVMLHGPIAAAALRRDFAVIDGEVLTAVAAHTAGLAEMPLIAKVILVADKVERRKRARAPQLPDIRRLARRDLDLALLCWADWKWVDERERGWGAYAPHWEARLRWVAEHHAELGLRRRDPSGDD
jgi:predicted HD superfamily hydrolase involved in NAD metabolism